MKANLLVRSMATKQIQLTFGGLHFGDIDMEEADGIGLEAFFGGLSPSISGYSSYAMAPRASDAATIGRIRDGGLEA